MVIDPGLVNYISKDSVSTLESAFENMVNIFFTLIYDLFDHLFCEYSVSVASSVCNSFGDGDNDEVHSYAVDFVGDIGLDLSMEIKTFVLVGF